MNPLAPAPTQGALSVATTALATSELHNHTAARGSLATAHPTVSPTSETQSEAAPDGNQMLAQPSHYFDDPPAGGFSEVAQQSVLSLLGST